MNGLRESKTLKEINLLTNKEDLEQNIFVKVRSTGSLLEAKVDLIDKNSQLPAVMLDEGSRFISGVRVALDG